MTSSDQPEQHEGFEPGRTRAPTPLLVAVCLVGLEALLLAGYGVAQLPALSSGRLVMGLTNALFFVIYGAGLGGCAVQLLRLRSWARAPVVLAQLIQLPVAWSFRGGGTAVLSAGLTAVAVVVLVGVFHPASLRAVGSADPD